MFGTKVNKRDMFVYAHRINNAIQSALVVLHTQFDENSGTTSKLLFDSLSLKTM
jgi:hypothetical protein